MFRVRLAAVLGLSFCLVMLLGGMSYWISDRLALNVRRNRAAHEAFEHYERLSHEAYRYFKQRMDPLATDNPAATTGMACSKRRLDTAIGKLKHRNAKASASKTAKTCQRQPAESERDAHLTDFLEASEYRFDEVEHLRLQGRRDEALQILLTLSEGEIDGIFQPQIDAVINGEHDKVHASQEQLEALLDQFRGITLVAAAAAALFSLASGLFLLGAVRKPVEALMRGADAIASGRLDHRIDLASRDEFGHLATRFNRMAEELGRQQEKLMENQAVLEQRVAGRTRELHRLNTQLRHMDTERREFLADISHELRTPITIIRGEAEVALRGREREAGEYKDALQHIAELSGQLGKYVNDLMFLARAETGGLQFDWDSLDLAGLVADAVEDFQVMAQDGGISVDWEAPAGAVWVRGDKQRLRQVLFILGDNACRYSRPGGRITARLRAENGDALFSLGDQGIGIPVQDLGRIFDRHFRGTNARQSREDGSGLGLPVAKSIVTAHGGRITVASTENAGTTFTVALPLVPAELDAVAHGPQQAGDDPAEAG